MDTLDYVRLITVAEPDRRRFKLMFDRLIAFEDGYVNPAIHRAFNQLDPTSYDILRLLIADTELPLTTHTQPDILQAMLDAERLDLGMRLFAPDGSFMGFVMRIDTQLMMFLDNSVPYRISGFGGSDN